MNTITTTSESLIVEPRGLDKLWSARRRLTIPIANVRGATFDPGANHDAKGLRGPGLAIAGKWAGTFTKNGEKAFWNVSSPNETIVIQLADEHFARLFLTVRDPRSVVDQINAAVQRG